MSDFDARLIELVRANPSLYERELRSKPYDASRKRKMEIWLSISTSLKSDVNTCCTRWNNLVSKLRRELAREKSGGPASDWSLLPQLRFMQHQSNHRSVANASWRSVKGEALVEDVHDEEDPLQEAMDEQLVGAVGAAPLSVPAAVPAPPPAAPVSAEMMKRIEALLDGLGEANRIKAEKRILAYLCKCNLRTLNEEPIDDIVI
ncbi:hypothetical protein KR009_010772 [Drosophila setifemur]|nr:hypothetical protein KR009_010772 [Drosophila setifemur]